MFLIRVCNNSTIHADKIGIKCNNCDKTVTYQLQHWELNSVITNFVLHMVFHYVVLLYIIKNNKYHKVEMEVQVRQAMGKGSQYNKTIFSKFNGHNFEGF